MLKLERLEQGFKAEISASLAEVDILCKELADFLAVNCLDEYAFAILLGAREALSNAVRHGSHGDQGEKVFFSIDRKAGRLILKVMDQGVGFDWLAAPRQLAGAAETGGRGIAMLRIYFDQVRFNQRGNEVELVKKITN